MIGTTNQSVSYWRNNPMKTSTTHNNKYDVIIEAGKLFSLNTLEQELLANTAGLSLHPFHKKIVKNTSMHLEISSELFPYPEKTRRKLEFSEDLANVLSLYKGTLTEVSDMALISERHLRYIRNGISLRKEPILGILLILGLGLPEIQTILKKAGYTLSKSLPNDTVIMWLLENDIKNMTGAKRILHANEILDSLGMPLLMAREKSDSTFQKP